MSRITRRLFLGASLALVATPWAWFRDMESPPEWNKQMGEYLEAKLLADWSEGLDNHRQDPGLQVLIAKLGTRSLDDARRLGSARSPGAHPPPDFGIDDKG